MKFQVTRTNLFDEDLKPCNGAVKSSYTFVDRRTVPTIEKAKKYFWFKQWFDNGINHREEGGMIACDRREPYAMWTVEIKDLKALLKFIDKHGQVVVSMNDNPSMYKIEIYDDYRE